MQRTLYLTGATNRRLLDRALLIWASLIVALHLMPESHSPLAVLAALRGHVQ